jgi:septal ring factor EnvC (AmiA/AmiB activator)
MFSAIPKRVKGTFSMPSPDERLTTLEYNLDQFKAEATSYYQEMALQVTMSKGLTEDAVKRLMQLRVQVDKRFNSTDQQLAEVKQELTGVKQELTGVKQDIGDHTTRLDRLETKVDAVQTTLAQILARLPEKP